MWNLHDIIFLKLLAALLLGQRLIIYLKLRKKLLILCKDNNIKSSTKWESNVQFLIINFKKLNDYTLKGLPRSFFYFEIP